MPVPLTGTSTLCYAVGHWKYMSKSGCYWVVETPRVILQDNTHPSVSPCTMFHILRLQALWGRERGLLISVKLTSCPEPVWLGGDMPRRKEREELVREALSRPEQQQVRPRASFCSHSFGKIRSAIWILGVFPTSNMVPFLMQMASFYWPLHKDILLCIVASCGDLLSSVFGEMSSLQFSSTSIPTYHVPDGPVTPLRRPCWIIRILRGAHEPKQSRHLIWTFQAADRALCYLSWGPCVLCFDVVMLMWEHNPSHAVGCMPAYPSFSQLPGHAGRSCWGQLYLVDSLHHLACISLYLCIPPGSYLCPSD